MIYISYIFLSPGIEPGTLHLKLSTLPLDPLDNQELIGNQVSFHMARELNRPARLKKKHLKNNNCCH